MYTVQCIYIKLRIINIFKTLCHNLDLFGAISKLIREKKIHTLNYTFRLLHFLFCANANLLSICVVVVFVPFDQHQQHRKLTFVYTRILIRLSLTLSLVALSDESENMFTVAWLISKEKNGESENDKMYSELCSSIIS